MARALITKFGSLVSEKVGIFQGSGNEELRMLSQKVTEKNQRIKKLRRRLEEKDREIAQLRNELAGDRAGAKTGSIKPENVVWIFGSGRSGSTWLAAMMEEMSDHTLWREPYVGSLFGNFYYVRSRHQIGKPGKHFILGGAYKETWMGPMRDMVLGGAAARFPELKKGGYLIIKEPNGSIGAPLLMEALPESRMICLIRDPRDVVASALDSSKEGGWRRKEAEERKRFIETGKNPDALARTWARTYQRHAGNTARAYREHRGPKTLVKYEELRVDTLGEMKRMYSELGIPVEEKELSRAVKKHSWENIPEEKKGEGKFYRKATPGGWREDLSPRQVEIVERATKPLLEEFYPDNTP